ncbi:MAG: ATPase P, partial [Verrucomicrobia bacterium]
MSETCRHCGNPVSREVAGEAGENGFCCSGCEYVYRLIRGQNLDRFYDLRDRKVDPVGAYVFRPRDNRWLKGLGDHAEEESKGRAVLTLRVQGISCVGCVWLIEKLVLDHEGMRVARVNASAGTVRLEWIPDQVDLEEIAGELQRFGYLLGPPGGPVRSESSRLTLRLGLCAAFAMNAMLFTLPVYLGMQPDFWFAWLFSALAFAFATLAIVVGGSYFFQRSLAGIRRGVIHIDLPISLGLVIAYLASCYGWILGRHDFIYFDFVATFSFLMLVGRWTQQVAVERNRSRLLDANIGLPRVEMVVGLKEGNVGSVAVDRLKSGDIYRIEPGQAVPVCSQLRVGDASFGLDWISGESEAQVGRNGQIISAGAINLSPGAVELEAIETWEESLLSRLLAGDGNPDREDPMLERIIRWYLLAVLAVAAIGAAGWFLATGQGLTALQVAISVLVVSCPCALGVSLPLADEMAASRMRRLGVYVQTDHLWSRLRRVVTIVFDKTGTLTLESPALKNRNDLEGLGSVDLAVLWAMVRDSRHPVSSCLREALLAGGWADDPGSDQGALSEEVGHGLEWVQGGETWRLGRPDWAIKGPVSPDPSDPVQ